MSLVEVMKECRRKHPDGKLTYIVGDKHPIYEITLCDNQVIATYNVLTKKLKMQA